MFHNFTFFEIKYAWGLIRWDLGHNQRKKNVALSVYSENPCNIVSFHL